jgi:hypothetical protein
MSNPANLKTLAQFVLLGDPSCTPCQVDPAADTATIAEIGAKALAVRDLADEVIDEEAQRKSARGAQHAAGVAAAAASSRPGPPADVAPKLGARIRALAEERGISSRTIHVVSTSGGVHFRSTAKAQAIERKVAVVIDDTQSTKDHRRVKLMVAYIIDDKIGRVEEIESR